MEILDTGLKVYQISSGGGGVSGICPSEKCSALKAFSSSSVSLRVAVVVVAVEVTVMVD